MARTYKWLGGIGYILTFIPYVDLVSPILVAIAWILMGRDTRERVFTILGILMIVLFAASAVLIFVVLASLLTWMLPLGMITQGEGMLPPGLIGFLWPMLVAILVIVGLGVVVFVFDIVAHFKAAGIFDNKWFKLGGWLRIGTIIASAVAIPLIIISVLSKGLQGILSQFTPSGPPPPGVLLSILWPLAIVVVVSLLATIFSIIAFFTIPEEAPQPEPPAGQQA